MNDEEKAAIMANIKRMRGGNAQEQEAARDAGCADGPGHSATKNILRIEPGELVRAAEELRDVFAACGAFYERGTPVCIAKRKGDKLPFASALTKIRWCALPTDFACRSKKVRRPRCRTAYGRDSPRRRAGKANWSPDAQVGLGDRLYS